MRTWWFGGGGRERLVFLCVGILFYFHPYWLVFWICGWSFVRSFDLSFSLVSLNMSYSVDNLCLGGSLL